MRLQTINEAILLEKFGKVHKSSCVLFEVPQSVAHQIQEWATENISSNDLYTADDDDYGRENHSHVTVKYGINSPDPKPTIKLLEDTGAFKVVLGEVSLFESSDKYDVVKLSISGAGLKKLNKMITDEIDCKIDKYPDYKAHLTLAYIKKGKGDKLVGPIEDITDMELMCHQLLFSSKDGSYHYINLVK